MANGGVNLKSNCAAHAALAEHILPPPWDRHVQMYMRDVGQARLFAWALTEIYVIANLVDGKQYVGKANEYKGAAEGMACTPAVLPICMKQRVVFLAAYTSTTLSASMAEHHLYSRLYTM